MNLLVSQQRNLRGIERDLAGSDSGLATLFSTFTLLTRDEELPPAERLKAGPERMLAWLAAFLSYFLSDPSGWR
jgi:hypothetical protein